MSELYSYQPLPDDVRQLIEAPLVPFDQLVPFDPVRNVYELDERRVEGSRGAKVHQFMQKIGGEVIILTQVETDEGAKLFELDTPKDKAKDVLVHAFPNAPVEKVELVFPPAA